MFAERFEKNDFPSSFLHRQSRLSGLSIVTPCSTRLSPQNGRFTCVDCGEIIKSSPSFVLGCSDATGKCIRLLMKAFAPRDNRKSQPRAREALRNPESGCVTGRLGTESCARPKLRRPDTRSYHRPKLVTDPEGRQVENILQGLLHCSIYGGLQLW